MNSLDGRAEVPFAWLCAQDGAALLLACGERSWAVGTFEYRSAHDVLSLTLLLSDRGWAPDQVDVGLLRVLLADEVEWAVWCTGCLLHDTALRAPDVQQATRALVRLIRSRLLAGSLHDARSRCTIDATRSGAGVGVGVALARALLDTSIDDPSREAPLP